MKVYIVYEKFVRRGYEEDIYMLVQGCYLDEILAKEIERSISEDVCAYRKCKVVEVEVEPNTKTLVFCELSRYDPEHPIKEDGSWTGVVSYNNFEYQEPIFYHSIEEAMKLSQDWLDAYDTISSHTGEEDSTFFEAEDNTLVNESFTEAIGIVELVINDISYTEFLDTEYDIELCINEVPNIITDNKNVKYDREGNCL